MVKIYKYELGLDGEVTKIKGKIRKILTVQLQSGVGPVCWCEVDERCKEIEISICAIGTGWELEKNIDMLDYIGTVQDGMGFVWHYYATPFMNHYGLNDLGDIFGAFFGAGVD